MTFFESLLVLLLAAILLLQASRRVGLPYPSMLALAGVVVAFVPGAPAIGLSPGTALVLFIAPVLLDASYDFPVGAARQLWRPLVVMAVLAVLLTAVAVAWIGWAVAGLPVAAALVMGAIVAPPDAAAATAVLRQVALPRRTVAVLKGESLFNDATALLLFGGALAVQQGGVTGPVALRLALAAPGGILVGIVLGLAMRRIGRAVSGTLGGSVLQFVMAYLVWVVAQHLGLSAVLAVVAAAMTVARSTQATGSPRMRVHSFAVWATVVFLLNVLAFLLMGLQARAIVGALPAARLRDASVVAALVIGAVVAVRFAVVMPWNRLAARYPRLRGDLPPPTPAQGVLVSWSGMRGLVTLATAFALPASFPQRDLVVLVAFATVLATLIVQGLTLVPLIRALGLDRMERPEDEVADARAALVAAALTRLEREEGEAAEELRSLYATKQRLPDAAAADRLDDRRRQGRAVIADQRAALDRLRDEQRVGVDTYYLLQEELDWRELTLLPEGERRIDEV